MKARGQRTHQMGSSNRNKETFDINYNTQSVFQRSFNKTKSLYCKPMDKTMPSRTQPQIGEARKNPFLGSHNELETQRFNKMNIKPYKYAKMIIPRGIRQVNMAPNLNQKVKDVQREFNGKDINMHKLNELKHAFVKNNRQRRDLKPYFQKYANHNGVIDIGSLKKIVKEYGFDINEDEARLIFRLTNRQKQKIDDNSCLKVDGFVELMTKEDVFYKTLRIGHDDPKSPRVVKHFTQKIHQILRNKFPKLKEAMKVHQQRNQDIDEETFNFVMKKLDLTNLVMSDEEKNQIFRNYSEDGKLNPEKLICAIAEQQYGYKPKKDKFRDFSQNLDTQSEIQHDNQKKILAQSLKNLSDLEYEKKLFKAKAVMTQLKKIRKEKQQKKQSPEIFDQIISDSISREGLAKKTEQILQKEGVNFQKQDYDAFVACMDFDVNGMISKENVRNTVFFETEKQARNRFERKTRNQAPKPQSMQDLSVDNKTAQQCIERIKSHKMNPENRELFKYFDKDLDGYISKAEFKQKLEGMSIMENWEINNLVSYLGIEQKGGVSFNQFTKRVNQNINNHETLKNTGQLPFVSFRNSKSCHDWSNVTSDKKNFIKTMNQPVYQRPSKYSAWPANLTQTDFSLIQAPSHAGTYATSDQRFRERKQDYGMKQKLANQAIAEGRRQRLADWNVKLQQRVQKTRQLQEQRQAARNYAIRLTQQKYEHNCHL